MPGPLFDFDVFLSFASVDAEASTAIWRTLSQGGLRVFWSTETLKGVVGKSFLGAIQDSLLKSQHFVLFWTAHAKRSAWVTAEHEAFYHQCYLKDRDSRRLIVLPDGLEPISSLPPFLQSLQIARSSQEVVTFLGGIDPQQLLRENRELRQQVDQLLDRNRELQASAGRLEARLAATPKELDLAKRSPVEGLPASPAADRAAEPESAELEGQALRGAEEALGQIELTSGLRVGWPWINETVAFQSWNALYERFGKLALRSLMSLLATPKRDWESQFKIVSLLTYATRSAEGREQSGEIIAAAAGLILQGGQVGKTALNLIVGTPAPLRRKWEVLFPLLQEAPIEKLDELVRRLAEVTPADERGRTAEAVAEILELTTQPGSIAAIVHALRALNSRNALPGLREALAEAPVEKANSLADLLAYFGDRDAVPSIRRAIETWRHGATPIQSLVSSLQVLEGHACHAYLAEILLDSQPQRQQEILSILNKSSDLTLLSAVSHLAEAATDSEVREPAKKYLAR